MTDHDDTLAAAAAFERLLAEAARINALVESAHERVDCPTCWAPKGRRCMAMPKGYVVGRTGSVSGREILHPHAQRIRAAGIPLR